MQPILVLRHSPSVHLGLLEAHLKRSEFSYRCTDYENFEPPDEVPPHKGLIVLGGSQSANDDLPGLQKEYSILESALRSRKPVLGICLGAQMLAKTLGASVMPASSTETGWHAVEATSEAASDPLFFDFGRRMVFHWHKETFDLPPGGVRLASSEACRNQAFRYMDFAWGIQFHPEVTPAMIAGWCAEDEAEMIRERTHEIDPFQHAAESAAVARLLVERWIGQIPRSDS